MTDHLTADALDRLAHGLVPPDELARADRHLASCETCRTALAALALPGLGVLAAVRGEARRHLTFDELERSLDGSERLDALAARHLASCESCQGELDDLRVFDRLGESASPRQAAVPALSAAAPVTRSAGRSALPTTATPASAAPATQSSTSGGWRWLRSPLVWGASLAVLALAVVPQLMQTSSSPDAVLRTPSIQATVRLAPEAPAALGAPSALQSGTASRLPNDLRLAIGRARTTARLSRMPQTVTATLTSREYDALLEELARDGALDPATPGAVPPDATDGLVSVTITIVPPAADTGGGR